MEPITLVVCNPDSGSMLSVYKPLEDAIKTLVEAVMRTEEFKLNLDTLGWYLDTNLTLPVPSDILTLIGEEIVWYPVTRL